MDPQNSMVMRENKWFTVWGSIVLTVAVMSLLGPPGNTDVPDLSHLGYDPCCSWPCENDGFCIGFPRSNYTCDCSGTEFTGKNCHIPASWKSWLRKKIKPDAETLDYILTNYDWFWNFINNNKLIHSFIMQYLILSRSDQIDTPVRFNGGTEYITLNSYYNETYYARSLPPVPKHCPTVMGDKGPKDYPDIDELVKKVFLRRQFKPDPQRTNVLFAYYAQHFSHQFFRTDQKKSTPDFTESTAGVDGSNIYGLTEEDRQYLRSGVDGKLKSQIIKGEEFPPYLKDVPGYKMTYPPNLTVPEESKFALGHPFFGLLPGLLAFATIWLREHNRVCDILKAENPNWDDSRLYETARLINIGQTIKITVEEYVPQLAQYKLKLTFEPELIHGTRLQYDNRIRAEFAQLYHWHPFISDTFKVENASYSIMDMTFNNTPILKHGIDKFVKAMVTNRAGALTNRNHPYPTIHILRKSMESSRIMRFQSINNYRRRFGMRPFSSFIDMTGDEQLAKDMEDLYHDIEAVEFYPGMLAEKPGASVTPGAMIQIGGPYSIKGLLANPICSPLWWKPSTFGGEVGFQIVKTATLKKLFCNNMAGKCDGFDLTFKTPDK